MGGPHFHPAKKVAVIQNHVQNGQRRMANLLSQPGTCLLYSIVQLLCFNSVAMLNESNGCLLSHHVYSISWIGRGCPADSTPPRFSSLYVLPLQPRASSTLSGILWADSMVSLRKCMQAELFKTALEGKVRWMWYCCCLFPGAATTNKTRGKLDICKRQSVSEAEHEGLQCHPLQ